MKENLLELLENAVKKFGLSPVKKNIINGKSFNEEGYRVAIRRACNDLTPRTLNRRPEVTDGMPVDDFLDSKNPDSFVGRIKEYFDKNAMSKEEFDEWHKDICDNCVLPVIRKYYTNKDKESSEVCYGKAQKVVNMTFKGCYCLDGAMTVYAEHFKYCHVALDSFTLTWYKRHGYKVDKEWSYLDYDTYITVQDNIAGLSSNSDIELFDHDDLTPFLREFLIWPLEIMVNTVAAINNCYGGLISEPYAEDYFKKIGLEKDLKMSNILLGKESVEALDEEYVKWLNDIPERQTGKRASADHILSLYNEQESKLGNKK